MIENIFVRQLSELITEIQNAHEDGYFNVKKYGESTLYVGGVLISQGAPLEISNLEKIERRLDQLEKSIHEYSKHLSMLQRLKEAKDKKEDDEKIQSSERKT